MTQAMTGAATDATAEIENSIRMALEAAEAANDSATEIERLSSDTRAAAERLDKFAKLMKPLVLGTVAGAVASVVIGGLVYFRTVAEMRSTAATQIEALGVFTQSVAELKQQVAAVQAQADARAAADEARQNNHAAVLAAIDAAKAEVAAQVSAQGATDAPDAGSAATAQMLRGLSEQITADHAATRDAFAAGLSDLQLALTKMMAETLRPDPAAKTAAAPKTTVAKTPSKPRAPQASAAKNPFKYP